MDAVTHLSPIVGVVAACDFLGVARATFYRQRPAPARALSSDERASVLAVLQEQRFQDRSPAAVQSIRTMYRILEKEGESGERRDQLVHPSYHKPELLATR